MTFIKSIALIILVPLSAVSFGQTIDELVKKAESRKKISELEINKALIGAYSNHREAKKNKEQIKNSAVKIEPSRCFWTVTQTSFHKWQLQDITSERKRRARPRDGAHARRGVRGWRTGEPRA